MGDPERSARDPGPDAPQHPPRSVVNPQVRRTALWVYLAPLIVFFAGVGIVLLYWGSSPPPRDMDSADRGVTGTSGTGHDPAEDGSPGGHDPDNPPSRTADEIDSRAGEALTALDEVVANAGRGRIGRRVELRAIDVERVDAPDLLWVRDGSIRVPVALTSEAASAAADIRAGGTVDIVGHVERSGDVVRIRASRVTPGRQRQP